MSRELFLADRVVKFEEGERLVPYYCSEGYPTNGWGDRIGEKNQPLPDVTWTKEQAQTRLDKKLVLAIKELSTNRITKPVWDSIVEDTDRKAILISMWYQLGITNLSEFTNTLKAIKDKNWKEAAEQMLDSDVARRVAVKRWKRQARAMLVGDVLSTYKFN